MAAGSASLIPLDQAALAASFSGFDQEDFALFEIPGFAARMPAIRERIKPKLVQIGQALVSRVSDILGEPQYPHVAQHLRRTVNAPEETWVAFSSSQRAYKPFVHYRIAVSKNGVRVLVYVEDYADEKAVFASRLASNAKPLSAYLVHHPTIHAYDIAIATGQAARGHEITAETLQSFAARMHRVKGQHARFGIPLAASHPVLQSGPEFLDAVIDAIQTLKPLYDCGAIPEFVYTYAPVMATSPEIL